MAHPRHSFTSPLRYPGGKGALSNFIKFLFIDNGLLDGHYVEPYAGGAAVAWPLLFSEYVQRVHLNDIDPAIFAFWSSVLYDTEDLCKMICDTSITMRVWRRQKATLERPSEHSRLDLSFAVFFLNRTNHSGILRGGVIGGKAQNGPWKMDARFNKKDLIARITRIARYSARISLYNLDAADFLRRLLPTLPSRSLLYLDPPYCVKGKDLYEHHYKDIDHKEIAGILTSLDDRSWVLTYDAVPQIMKLYRGHHRLRYELSYSAQERYRGSEIMFISKAISKPDTIDPARVTFTHVQRALFDSVPRPKSPTSVLQ